MRILAAMSGGVDSSVAAAMLVDAGHEVVGTTMRLWGGESDTGCCSVSEVDDARRVAHRLGIDHHVFNLADDFDRHVVEPYVADHAAGRTPNPCVECNRHLKFDKLLRRAAALGFDAVATGHHANFLNSRPTWSATATPAPVQRGPIAVQNNTTRPLFAGELSPMGTECAPGEGELFLIMLAGRRRARNLHISLDSRSIA